MKEGGSLLSRIACSNPIPPLARPNCRAATSQEPPSNRKANPSTTYLTSGDSMG